MAKPRTARQRAALKKAQIASARKRRGTGKPKSRGKIRPGGPSKKGHAIAFALGGAPGMVGYHLGAMARRKRNYGQWTGKTNRRKHDEAVARGKKKSSSGKKKIQYKHGKHYQLGDLGTFRYNGKTKNFESTQLYKKRKR